MEDYQIEKQRFVEDRIAPMVAAMTYGDIASAEYAAEGQEEFVHVVFRNGYRKRVCVTGDSLRALAEDVLAVL